MKYAYENLSDGQFERLVVILAQELFGVGTQGFATGVDGGRDAKFVGTAQVFPSTSQPWVGTTIIQAKHTNGFNRSFSDTEFFQDPSGPSTVIGEEIPRIKKLRDSGELDHYLLVANRKLPANASVKIRTYIATECGIPLDSVYLCGLEQLELWLKRYKTAAEQADLDPDDCPLIVSPDDLSEVVQAFAGQLANLAQMVDSPPTPRIDYVRKNQLNNMSEDYATEQRKRYLKDTVHVQRFLSAPENMDLLKLYESVVEEFQLKIIAKRHQHNKFDEVMEYLLDLLFSRDAVLNQRTHKRLTRVILYYMYWNCDIGKVDDDAETDETLASGPHSSQCSVAVT